MAAKVTDLRTGETREASDEELLEALKHGKGTFVRVGAGDSGILNPSNTNFGESFAESIINSVNIFADRGTIEAFMFRAVDMAKNSADGEVSEGNESELSKGNESLKGYTLIVDELDKPFMYICRHTDEKIELNIYVRDDKRSIGEPDASTELKVINGQAEINGHDIKEDSKLLYILAFNEMMKFLIKTGDWERLEKSEDGNSGVIIKASGHAADATAKIVTGYDRPDLPCMLFGGMFAESVDDAVMMRPYIDEHIRPDIKSNTTIREEKTKTTAGSVSNIDEQRKHNEDKTLKTNTGKTTTNVELSKIEQDILSSIKYSNALGFYGGIQFFSELGLDGIYSGEEIGPALRQLVKKGMIIKEQLLRRSYYILPECMEDYENFKKGKIEEDNKRKAEQDQIFNYNKNADPNSIAAKANMVAMYKERPQNFGNFSKKDSRDQIISNDNKKTDSNSITAKANMVAKYNERHEKSD